MYQTGDWSMKLRFDYNNMMTSAIGSHGIAPSVIDKAQKAHVAAFKEVIDNSGDRKSVV